MKPCPYSWLSPFLAKMTIPPFSHCLCLNCISLLFPRTFFKPFFPSKKLRFLEPNNRWSSKPFHTSQGFICLSRGWNGRIGKPYSSFILYLKPNSLLSPKRPIVCWSYHLSIVPQIPYLFTSSVCILWPIINITSMPLPSAVWPLILLCCALKDQPWLNVSPHLHCCS